MLSQARGCVFMKARAPIDTPATNVSARMSAGRMRLLQANRSELIIREPVEWPAKCQRRQFTEKRHGPFNRAYRSHSQDHQITWSMYFSDPDGGLHRERRLLHRRDLFAQLQDARLPGARRIEPRKCGRESRILPAARDPRRIVNQPQR